MVRTNIDGNRTRAEPPQLAKKPNYDFEKRKKELDRKAKRDEKIRNKRTEAARLREESESPLTTDQAPTPGPE